MRAQIGLLTAVSALAVLGTGAAQASVLAVTASGGSEALLNIVSNADSSSISLDLGKQAGGLSFGDEFVLGQSVTDFITAAGGLGGVRFSVIAGSAANGTSAATYLQSSDNASLTSIANGVRGTWFTNFDTFARLRLNASNPGDTDTTVNGAYGPFGSGVAGNYLTAGTDDWGTASTCISNDNVCNLVSGTLSANLFLVNFGTSPTGFAGTSQLFGESPLGGALAELNLATGRLLITSASRVVPVPAAAWLMGSALGLLGMMRRRQAAA